MQNLLFSYSSIPLWIPLSSSLPPLLPITTSELHSKKVLLIPMILATISTKSSIRMKPLKKSLLKITVWYSFSIMRNNLQCIPLILPWSKKKSKLDSKFVSQKTLLHISCTDFLLVQHLDFCNVARQVSVFSSIFSFYFADYHDNKRLIYNHW